MRGWIGAAVATWIVVAPAETPAAPAAAPAIWTLPNGLTVAHVGLDGSPVAAVQVWYRAGTADDPAGKRGVAALFERLLDAGSTRVRPGDHRRHIAAIGGDAHVSVLDDATACVDTVPADQLELALALEAERMRSLELTAAAVQAAIRARAPELARLAESPRFRVHRRLFGAAFVQHPYGRAAAPDPAELESIALPDVRAFYDAYYQPGNAIVVVVGGVERAAVEAAVVRSFGGLPRAAPPRHPSDELPEPPQSARRRDEVAGAAGSLAIGFHTPAAGDPAIHALRLAERILLGRGGRLAALVRPGGVDAIDGGLLRRRDPGLLVVRVAGPPAALEAVEREVGAALAALASRGPSAAELERARWQSAALTREAEVGASGIAAQLGHGWALTGDPGAAHAALAAEAAMTGADVRAAVARFLAADRATVVVGRDEAAR